MSFHFNPFELYILAKFKLDPNNQEQVIGPSGNAVHGSIKTCGYRRVDVLFQGKIISMQYARLKFFLKHKYNPQVVDHRNRNKLDNRHCNLMAATFAQNSANTVKKFGGSSTFKGVIKNPSSRSPWRARYGRHHIGVYKTEADAARAYDAYVRTTANALHATYNFPVGNEQRAI